MGTKGNGVTLYIDVDSDDEYVELGCIRSMTPPGMTRGTVSEPACLNGGSQATQDTDDLQYSELQMVIDHGIDDAIDQALEAAIIADTQIQVCIKYPATTPVYAYFDAKLTAYSGQDVQKRQTIKKQLSMLPMSAWTYNTTQPTLEA